ncbi:MAG TPA: peroxiredoxin [Ignavibacteriaceae bacterium]|nr:peroxiredoxin [Ignavibacteriaceae bacterium]
MTSEKIVQNFILTDQDGKDFELYKNLNKNILLVFYPKDDSRVCSKQLKNYYENENLFTEKNIKIVGINTDSIESHQKFCSKLGIKIPLLNDRDKEVSKYFNALNIFGINKRKIVLINRDKQIIFEKDIPYTSYPDSVELVNNFDSLKDSR